MGCIAYAAAVCPNARIFTTPTTRDFLRYQLADVIAEYIGADSEDLRFSNELLCRLVLNRIETVPYQEKQQFSFVSRATGQTSVCRFSFFPAGHIPVADTKLSYNGLLNIALGIIIMLVLFYVLQKTKMGIAIRTTASNEPVARLMGVPTRNVTLFAWALAAVLGALAGIMNAPATTVTTGVMDTVQINALIACVLGGFQTFYGPILGAYIIAVGSNLLNFYVSSVWGTQIMYLLILLFVVFRPQGLIGKKIVKKV